MSNPHSHFHSHGRVEYTTPQWLFDALNSEFGFTLDAAADSKNAKCRTYYSAESDGLTKDWADAVVWCNPPYGKGITAAWVKKGYEASRRGATVVMLVPVRADAKWWHDYAMKGEIRMFRNRLNFGNEYGVRSYAPFASAIIVFRPANFALLSLPEVRELGHAP